LLVYEDAAMHSTSPGQVIVLNGVPCSGKTTLARAFQADLNEPWLGIDLDTFTPRLPPRRTAVLPNMCMVMIRDARESDLDEILQIRNHAIVHSTATWTDEVESLQDCFRWLAERRSAGEAVLVAEADGSVVGYAAYTRWRPKPGYRYTVADSVYVVDGHQGKGIGKMLLAELIACATTAGKHVMIADIESTNAVSINLHRSLGFVPVGDLPQIGRKFDRWLDLSILTLSLRKRGTPGRTETLNSG